MNAKTHTTPTNIYIYIYIYRTKNEQTAHMQNIQAQIQKPKKNNPTKTIKLNKTQTKHNIKTSIQEIEKQIDNNITRT